MSASVVCSPVLLVRSHRTGRWLAAGVTAGFQQTVTKGQPGLTLLLR